MVFNENGDWGSENNFEGVKIEQDDFVFGGKITKLFPNCFSIEKLVHPNAKLMVLSFGDGEILIMMPSSKVIERKIWLVS